MKQEDGLSLHILFLFRLNRGSDLSLLKMLANDSWSDLIDLNTIYYVMYSSIVSLFRNPHFCIFFGLLCLLNSLLIEK